eukprot:g3397.t1
MSAVVPSPTKGATPEVSTKNSEGKESPSRLVNRRLSSSITAGLDDVLENAAEVRYLEPEWYTKIKRVIKKSGARRGSILPRGLSGLDFDTLQRPDGNSASILFYEIVDPDCFPRRCWDLMISLLVVYLVIQLPIEVFDIWDGKSGFLTAMGIVVDIIFWGDIILNFRTGFIYHGKLVNDQNSISKHYLLTWFFIDFFGNLPLEVIVSAAIGDSALDKSTRSLPKVLKWFKLNKLLRVGRIIKYLQHAVRYAEMTKIIITLLWLLHFSSCMVQSIRFGDLTKEELKTILHVQQCGDASCLYFESLFYVLSTFLGHAHHEVIPYTLSSFFMLMGLLFMTLLFANVALLVADRDCTYSMFRRKVANIQAQMAHHQMPYELRDRVEKYYNYLWMNQKVYHNSALYHNQDLSLNLRKKMALYMHGRLLRKVPIFADCTADCIAIVIMKLHELVYMPSDFVMHEGDIGHELYIIGTGTVRITKNNRNICTLGSGQFFGEIALLEDCHRTASAQATSISELHVLQKLDFLAIGKEYPDILLVARGLAMERQNRQKLRNTLWKVEAQSATIVNEIENNPNKVYVPDEVAQAAEVAAKKRKKVLQEASNPKGKTNKSTTGGDGKGFTLNFVPPDEPVEDLSESIFSVSKNKDGHTRTRRSLMIPSSVIDELHKTTGLQSPTATKKSDLKKKEQSSTPADKKEPKKVASAQKQEDTDLEEGTFIPVNSFRYKRETSDAMSDISGVRKATSFHSKDSKSIQARLTKIEKLLYHILESAEQSNPNLQVYKALQRAEIETQRYGLTGMGAPRSKTNFSKNVEAAMSMYNMNDHM